VGHSFGGDSAVEIAQELNTIENGFRKIDLLITLDSVGSDNDFIPQNVKKNLNFLAQGPYEFLNDGPNIAKNYHKTEVENYLRQEEHADLDDTTDIQVQILEQIEKILS
jgi:thioesterase domain-containing protein